MGAWELLGALWPWFLVILCVLVGATILLLLSWVLVVMVRALWAGTREPDTEVGAGYVQVFSSKGDDHAA